MKKLVIFGLTIVVIFTSLAFITNSQNKQLAEGNPFGKTNLHPETIKQLDDPNYENIILPQELDEKFEAGESFTIYYYSPTCPACEAASPVLVPKAEEMGVEVKLFNLEEFKEGWNDYGIENTPTLIHYENGEEVARIVGLHEEENYEIFYRQIVKNK